MLGAFIITGMHSSVVSLFWDLVSAPFPIYICGVKFLGCAICLVSGIAAKAAMPFPNSFTIF